MKRSIAVVIAAMVAMLTLAGCTSIPESTERVKVIGKNLALLPAGETMILHSEGEYPFTWIITYNGGSTVNFFREKDFAKDDNVDITVPFHGEKKFDPGFMELDMWASRQSETAVGIRWEFGLDFQPYES